jgi:uncharacterized protein YndB with AHSA1/START domain
MSDPVIHDTFTLERVYPASADQVFRALADPVKKRRWFAEGDGFVVDGYTMDFRVGGTETVRFRFGDGPSMTTDSVYLDIIDNQRVIFAYAMTVGGKPLSSSITSMELSPARGGTHLRFTEHAIYTDGNDGSESRREGTRGLLEALAKELAEHGDGDRAQPMRRALNFVSLTGWLVPTALALTVLGRWIIDILVPTLKGGDFDRLYELHGDFRYLDIVAVCAVVALLWVTVIAIACAVRLSASRRA